MAATGYAPQGCALLPLPAHNPSFTALGGYFVKSIDIYEVLINDTITRDDIGQIAWERKRDDSTGRFVQRTLRAIHTMVITNRDGFRTFTSTHPT